MVEEMDVVTLNKLLATKQAVVVDVREADEFQSGHIEGAVSIPLSVFEQKFSRSDFPTDKKVVLQCRGGVRSMKACQIAYELAKKEDVANLTGGLSAWQSAGLPVTK